MTYSPPQYAGLSIEASYRFDERLAILGAYKEPTVAQYLIAWDEAIAFDNETVRRRLAKSVTVDNSNKFPVDPLG